MQSSLVKRMYEQVTTLLTADHRWQLVERPTRRIEVCPQGQCLLIDFPTSLRPPIHDRCLHPPSLSRLSRSPRSRSQHNCCYHGLHFRQAPLICRYWVPKALNENDESALSCLAETSMLSLCFAYHSESLYLHLSATEISQIPKLSLHSRSL